MKRAGINTIEDLNDYQNDALRTLAQRHTTLRRPVPDGGPGGDPTGRAEPDRWISYSRRKAFYAGQQRYRGSDYKYSTVPPAIDELARLGWLENDKKPPRNLGWQSRIRATPSLLESITSPLPVIHVPRELIRLKDKDGRLIDYRDTAFTEAARLFLKEYNEALAATRIDLEAPGVVRDGDTLHSGELTLYTAMKTYYRVFNWRRFTLGGRNYGTFWLQARKADRAYMTINDKPVNVPAFEISSWRGGQLPRGLRAGVIYEMRRRNLRQAAAARRIGLSRPQLTNALRGRFGIGAQAAERLKAFVLEAATIVG